MIEEINIDKIYFRLFDDNGFDHPTKIENSPVYNVLCGNKDFYNEYYKRMVKLGRAKAGYMDTEDFLKFENSFNYLAPPYDGEYVRVKQTGHLYAGWDGAHRISIEKKRGKKTIKAILMDGGFKHKGYSNLVDLSTIFDNLKYDDYVIIKDDGMFPNYIDDDDLDLLCKDRNVLREEIIKSLKIYKELGYKINENDKQVRHHIDIIPEGTSEKNLQYGFNNLINFRFDLLDQTPYLQQHGHFTNKIEIKDNFFDFILERKIKKEFKWPVMFENKGKFKANFPCEVDDLVLRFMEWVWQPHKERHIKYVINNLKNTSEFIEVVNEFTNVEIDNNYIKKMLN
jgi:hypothetical protein|tara:strand:+ start:5155 stop:6174 length:1020 start_codon:yes stop_codon:yes gene_type:complete